MKTGSKGAVIASAVALMFMTGVAIAQDNGSMGGGSAMSAQTASVKCLGANDCKGKSACKSVRNDCKGQNSCKGKGFINTSSTQKCQDMGGKPESM